MCNNRKTTTELSNLCKYLMDTKCMICCLSGKKCNYSETKETEELEQEQDDIFDNDYAPRFLDKIYDKSRFGFE